LKPLFDRVLVQRLARETKTASGLLLPSTAQQKLNQGTILSVGSKVDLCSTGDRVLLPEYGGTKVKMDDKDETEYLIFRQEDILAVIKTD
jgi:chaperonin GroES